MTNLEKWKKKLQEAEDGSELIKTIYEMETALSCMCEIGIPCKYDTCKECKAKWLDMEAGDGK